MNRSNSKVLMRPKFFENHASHVKFYYIKAYFLFEISTERMKIQMYVED